jgi:hypothetical protein
LIDRKLKKRAEMAMRIKIETVMNNRLRTHHSTEIEPDSSLSEYIQEEVEDKEVEFLNRQAGLVNEQFQKIKQAERIYKKK